MAQQQEAVLRHLDAEVKEPALPTRSIVDLGLIKVVLRHRMCAEMWCCEWGDRISRS